MFIDDSDLIISGGECSVKLTDVINFIVCCRFGEVHISVQPFLKFVAARESFRWLRFQLFP